MTAEAAKQGIDIVNSIEMFEDRILIAKRQMELESIECLDLVWLDKSLIKSVCNVVINHCESKIKELKRQLIEL